VRAFLDLGRRRRRMPQDRRSRRPARQGQRTPRS
jgi:hypothetical protein